MKFCLVQNKNPRSRHWIAFQSAAAVKIQILQASKPDRRNIAYDSMY